MQYLDKTGLTYFWSKIKNEIPSEKVNELDDIINGDSFANDSGTGLTLDTIEAPIVECLLKGDTEQDGTPAPDSPIEVKTATGRQEIDIVGKNLLNIQGIVKGRLDNGIIGYESSTTDLTLNDDSFSFTTNANYRGVVSDYIAIASSMRISYDNYNSDFNLNIACYDGNFNWIANGSVSGNASQKERSLSVVSGTKYVRLYISLTTAGTLTITNPMLVKGTTVEEYERYKGQSYEINLGKNLFDKDNISWYRNNSSDFSNTNNDNTSRIRSSSFSIEGGKTYTISGLPDGITLVSIRTFQVSSEASIGNATLSGNTFTLNSDVNYIHLLCGGTGFTSETNTLMANADIQIEKGSQATSYSAYKEPIELCKIGTYRDKIYKENGTWYLEKQIGKLTLNGSETWNGASVDTNVYRFYTTISNIYEYEDATRHIDRFINDRFSLNANNVFGASYQYHGNLYFCVSDSEATTTATFKTWLSSNNVTLYYVLASSVVTAITDTELLTQLNSLGNATTYNGTTNIMVSGELPVILDITTLANTLDGRVEYLNDIINTKQDTLVSGTNIKTINNQSLLGSGNINIAGSSGNSVDVQVNGTSIISDGVANLLTEETYNSSSNKLATKQYVDNQVSTKQATLVSGTNIKTINNQSLLGSGNISISEGTSTDVQINETSIVSNGTANIVTETDYNSSSNKLATMIDVNNGVYQGMLNILFDEYSTTSTYNQGDIILYNNDLYVCWDDNVTGIWNLNKWYKYKLSDILGDLNEINTLTGDLPVSLSGTIDYLDGVKEEISNKVTSLSSSSTDDEYPSAKCVYDLIGDIESLLGGI